MTRKYLKFKTYKYYFSENKTYLNFNNILETLKYNYVCLKTS